MPLPTTSWGCTKYEALASARTVEEAMAIGVSAVKSTPEETGEASDQLGEWGP